MKINYSNQSTEVWSPLFILLVYEGSRGRSPLGQEMRLPPVILKPHQNIYKSLRRQISYVSMIDKIVRIQDYIYIYFNYK